jgi:hypothetical protein
MDTMSCHERILAALLEGDEPEARQAAEELIELLEEGETTDGLEPIPLDDYEVRDVDLRYLLGQVNDAIGLEWGEDLEESGAYEDDEEPDY